MGDSMECYRDFEFEFSNFHPNLMLTFAFRMTNERIGLRANKMCTIFSIFDFVPESDECHQEKFPRRIENTFPLNLIEHFATPAIYEMTRDSHSPHWLFLMSSNVEYC